MFNDVIQYLQYADGCLIDRIERLEQATALSKEERAEVKPEIKELKQHSRKIQALVKYFKEQ